MPRAPGRERPARGRFAAAPFKSTCGSTGRSRPTIIASTRQSSTGIDKTLRRGAKLSGVEDKIPLAGLLSLPGIVSEKSDTNADAEAHWPLVLDTLMAAIENMDKMRAEEGRAMEGRFAGELPDGRRVPRSHRGPRPAGRRGIPHSACRTPETRAGRVRGDARPGRFDQRGRAVRRAERHFGRDRPATQPLGAVRDDHDPSRRAPGGSSISLPKRCRARRTRSARRPTTSRSLAR